MTTARDKILIVEGDAATRESLLALVRSAGYEAEATATAEEGFEIIQGAGADVLFLDANLSKLDCCAVLTEMKGSAATAEIRVILLSAGGAAERARGLDMGADDVISRPWEAGELLARVRAQLRAKRAENELREKTKIAEEGQQIAHTAFEALAVTEKMTRDAFSLERALKIGVAAILVVAGVMAVTFFLFSHRAQKQTQFANGVIARLNAGQIHQQELIAQARKERQQLEQAPAGSSSETKQKLQQQADQLRTQMAKADSTEVTALQQQLEATNARLRRVEQEGEAGQNIVRSDVQSVCLIHVSVAFRHKESGQRLRYGGVNSQGDPLLDGDGNPILTIEGRGPEVRVEVFGTGFLAAPGGRVVTNRHVAQPWWNNDEMSSLLSLGMQPEIAEIEAFFPDAPSAFSASIKQISSEADLAIIQVDLGGIKRPALATDTRKDAAVSGQTVVSVGYATGLAAILARADEGTVKQIADASGDNPKQILAELAKRKLIYPLVTQGHIGEVLPDKIVFDAQTTSGGSGGPLFNQEGKVIGVTYAVLKGFGGSNFGIPIRFSQPLLAH
jgi:DNA-binding response OmpR family regulator